MYDLHVFLELVKEGKGIRMEEITNVRNEENSERKADLQLRRKPEPRKRD